MWITTGGFSVIFTAVLSGIDRSSDGMFALSMSPPANRLNIAKCACLTISLNKVLCLELKVLERFSNFKAQISAQSSYLSRLISGVAETHYSARFIKHLVRFSD